MGIVRLLHDAQTAGLYRDFLASCRSVEAAQRRLWSETRQLIGRGPFWRERLGGGVKRLHLDDFDITTYGDYAQALRRDYASDVSSLTREKIPYWLESSASTGVPKIFPATETFFRSQCTAPAMIFSHALSRRFPGHMVRPAFSLAASRPATLSPAGIRTGLVTYWGHRRISRLVRRLSAVPLPLYDDLATFDRWAPVYAVAGDLSSIRALSASGLHRFLARIAGRRDELVLYLERGRPLPPGLPPLRVSSERLRVIRKAFERPVLVLKDLWPSLEFIRTWKTGACGLQVPMLAEHLTSDVEVIDHIYGTTEGSVAVPLFIGRNGGPVLVNTIVVEFLDTADEVHRKNLRPAWRVEIGRRYRVFLTNKMGLVRYQVGDIVRCTGHVGQAPIIEFVEREEQDLSFGAATLTEGQLVEAARRMGLDAQAHWVFAPNAVGNGLVFCFDSSTLNGDDLARRAEDALRELNPLYASCSRRGMLAPIQPAFLSCDHPLWSGAAHAQSKQRVLVKQPI